VRGVVGTSFDRCIINEGKIPVQELVGQRGEGAYFRRGAYFRDNTVITTVIVVHLPLSMTDLIAQKGYS
jgi:hypothetical protein